METSIFPDKDHRPSEDDLETALGRTFPFWLEVKQFVFDNTPGSFEEWNFSKAGWNYRIKDKKRAIIYLMPGKDAFRVAMVFGEKAVQKILAGNFPESIKDAIRNAKTYAEGRGIRIEITDSVLVENVKDLVKIKSGL